MKTKVKYGFMFLIAIVLSGNISAQVLDFTWMDSLACGETSVFFINISEQGWSDFVWDFGDGTILATDEDPMHTYASAGTYTVTLSAVDTAQNAGSVSHSITLTGAASPLNPQYTSSVLSSDCNGDEIQFDGTVGSGTVFFWNWTFVNQSSGETLFSTGQSTTMSLGAGQWDVELEIFSDQGCLERFSGVVDVLGTANSVEADFDYTIAEITCDSITLQFNDLSTGNIDNWQWEFLDGFQNFISSSAQNPLISFPLGIEFVVVDLAVSNGFGCIGELESEIILPDTGFSVYVNAIPISCTGNGSDGAIDIALYNGVSPYSLSVNGGAFTTITPDVDGHYLLSGLTTGTYDIEVMDANGCSYEESLVVEQGDLQLFEDMIFSNFSCSDSGSYIGIEIESGTPPYSVLWSDGSTQQFISDPAPGLHTVIVSDAGGCQVSASITVPDGECYTISGYLHTDDDGNCTVDAGVDFPLAYITVIAEETTSGTQYFGLTDANGYYEIQALEGVYDMVVDGYSLTNYTAACPASGIGSATINDMNPLVSVDFYYEPIADIADLRIALSGANPVPGFSNQIYLSASNDGTIPMSGNIVYEYDPNLSYVSSFPAADNHNASTHTLTWSYSSLLPFDNLSFLVDFSAPVALPLGTPIVHEAVVNPVSGDATPLNNEVVINRTVVGSYDPNDKAVYPDGDITVNDKDHNYTIRFQNTGTAPAIRVEVRDDLDDDLDVSTIRNITSSHNFVLYIENEDELVFVFDNIMLPDSGSNYEASNGHINFTISQKPNLALGTVIENTAAIYFDFNAPIITNTVRNEIVNKTVGIRDASAESRLSIYPNPSSGVFHLILDQGYQMEDVYVYNVLGSLAFHASTGHSDRAVVDLSHLNEGMYIVEIRTSQGKMVQSILLDK